MPLTYGSPVARQDVWVCWGTWVVGVKIKTWRGCYLCGKSMIEADEDGLSFFSCVCLCACEKSHGF